MSMYTHQLGRYKVRDSAYCQGGGAQWATYQASGTATSGDSENGESGMSEVSEYQSREKLGAQAKSMYTRRQ